MNDDDMESQDVAASEQSIQSSKKRTRSRCWLSFEQLPPLPDGSRFARCKKCGKKLSNNPSSGTNNLVRHHDSCGALSTASQLDVHPSTFSHDKFCELIIEAVVKHDLPFHFVEYEGIRAAFDYVSAGVHLPSRNTAKNHVMNLYEIEKLKLKDLLSKSKGRICLTSDLWSSQTADGYLALTAHFLDSDWNLQKKVLNFSHMPPPHTGNALAEKFKRTLESLFDAYKIRWSVGNELGVHLSEGCSYSQDEDPLFQVFDLAYKEGTRSSIDSELSIYLKEQKLERMAKVDVLSWWKTEQFRYPILSRLAGDILAIPISTVASESAFSTGGRVLDQYRSSLLPETAEALLCCRDWLFDKKCEESINEEDSLEDALDMEIV